MSAAPRYPDDLAVGLGYAGLRMTAEQYLALGETHDRYELIDGVVCMSPSPTPIHSEVVVEVLFQLKTFARAVPGTRVFTETDLQLTPDLVYRPDACVYSAGTLVGSPRRLRTPPSLVVEVLSPKTRALDLITKRHDFDRFGVGEYWIIDPDNRSVTVLRRTDGALTEAPSDSRPLPTPDLIACSAIPGLTLDLAPIRAIPTE